MKKKVWFTVLVIALAVLAGTCAAQFVRQKKEFSAEMSQTEQTESVLADDSPKNLPFSAQYIRTNGYQENAVYPQSCLIFSSEQLQNYYQEYKDVYDLDSSGFSETMEQYSEAFFEKSSLLLILLEEGSGSIQHEVTAVQQTPGLILADIHREVPEMGTTDMAEWHILIEIPRISEENTAVSVRIDDVLQGSSVSGLAGIGVTDAEKPWEDTWGLKLTAKNITPGGLTLVFDQQDGSPSGELQTGTPYTLEKLEGDKWTEVEPIIPKDSIAWTMIAWEIPKNDRMEKQINWRELYRELSEGTYRICKTVQDFRKPGDYDEKTYYAEFQIIQAQDGQMISCEHSDICISLPYVPGWEYQIETDTDENRSFGVNYRPLGTEGWIRYHYDPSFGVCGTGLESKDYGGGQMGIYDGNAVWSFIAFPVSQEDPAAGAFVAETENVNSWWPLFEKQAMKILDGAVRKAAF